MDDLRASPRPDEIPQEKIGKYLVVDPFSLHVRPVLDIDTRELGDPQIISLKARDVIYSLGTSGITAPVDGEEKGFHLLNQADLQTVVRPHVVPDPRIGLSVSRRRADELASQRRVDMRRGDTLDCVSKLMIDAGMVLRNAGVPLSVTIERRAPIADAV